MKITTDDAGINVTWKPRLGYPLRRASIAARAALAVAMAVNLVILAGLFPSYFRAGLLNVAGLVLCAFSFMALSAVAARWRRILAPAVKPRLDYALIARAEMETEGRTFHHADAPCRCDECATSSGNSAWSVAERDAFAATCEKFDQLAKRQGTYIPRVEVRRYGADLCAERGHHIHMLGAAGCLVCNGDR